MNTEGYRLFRAVRKPFSGTCWSLLALGALGCGEASSSQTAEPVGKAGHEAYVDTWTDSATGYRGYWNNINNIRVCWETDALLQAAVGHPEYNPIANHNYRPSDFTADYGALASLAQVKEWAKQAVIKAWQDPSRLTFTGWQNCTAGEDAIHIAVFNWNGFTRGRGEFLRGKPNGMWLNAWAGADKQQPPWPFAVAPNPGGYRNCDGSLIYDGPNPGWKGTQKSCVEWTAIHEFGHALGFIHEHNRPENTGANANHLCPVLLPENPVPTSQTVGPYDPFSIMNYCTRYVHNEGWPSVLDMKGLQTFYGARWEKQPGSLGHVAAAQESANRTVVASIGGDGTVYARYLHVSNPTIVNQPRHNDDWSAPVAVSGTGVAPAGGAVVLGKRSNELHAFYVGSTGALHASKSVNFGAWTSQVLPNFTAGGGGVATGIRNSTELSVFAVAANGAINRFTSTGTGAFVGPVAITAAGYAVPGGALATGIQNGTHLAVFTVGSNGAIKAVTKAMTAPLNDPWASVTISAANFAPAGAALATGLQNGTQLDVFVVANNNRLRYFWAVGTGWQGPDPDRFPDAVFSAGGKLAVLTQGSNLHVYAVGAYGPSGHLSTATHDGTSWTTYGSDTFLPVDLNDSLTASYGLPSTGVAAVVTAGALKPTVFFAGLSGLIRAWYSPVPNRYTPGAFGDPRPHGNTAWPAEMQNQPTRFAPMR